MEGQRPTSTEWDRASGRFPGARPAPGFTLIEMIVVVAIIGVLLAIAVPVSAGLIKSQKRAATLSTMGILEQGIIRPFQERKLVFNEWFGNYPASPTARLTNNTSDPADLQYSEPLADITAEKFVGEGTISEPGLLGALIRPTVANATVPTRYCARATDGSFKFMSDPVAVEASRKFATIESLIIFAKVNDPQSRAVIDRLGKALTNTDADGIDRNGDGAPDEDLFEVRDAWGQALQYTVRRSDLPDGRKRYEWELRSAGADESKFDAPFTEAEGSDDVVASGGVTQ